MVNIDIDGTPIKFVDSTEHVGVTRSVHGNFPHILNRFSSHNKSLHAVLPVGLARGHRGNPAAALRVEKLYGIPVLLSGTASLVLKQLEIDILNSHLKAKLENLQKLHKKTPDPVVYFLAGSLPASALLHLRQLSLFSMITRLPENILNRIGRYILTTTKDSYKSWFNQIKSICQLYHLPHPLSLLNCPLSKEASKKLFKRHVVQYWQTKLRYDASHLESLKYFKPQFMSLSSPHPLWLTCGSNSYEICKAVVQAKMLSGRYRTDQLVRHFSDKDGSCTLCSNASASGNIEHLLVHCPALTHTRSHLLNNLEVNANISDTTKLLIKSHFGNEETIVQLILDPSVLPQIIMAKQTKGPNIIDEIFKFSRSWCYSIHKTRLKLQGRWTKN